MTEQYKGLCIGGPRDGETYTSTRGPEFFAHLPTPVDPVAPLTNSEVMATVVSSKMVYRHVLQWTGDDKHGRVMHGFWVPDEHFPVAQWYIMTELCKAYEWAVHWGYGGKV